MKFCRAITGEDQVGMRIHQARCYHHALSINSGNLATVGRIRVDAAGNHSAGVAAVIVPRRNLLKSPKDGARLRKAPKLTWALDSEAAYYNAQLLLNGKKILSVWPTSPAFALKKTWRYEGRKYTLAPGLYTWFVWPGYGARSAVDYGELMGSRTFRIVR